MFLVPPPRHPIRGAKTPVSVCVGVERPFWLTHFLRLIVGAVIVGVPLLVLTPAVGRARGCYQFHHDQVYFTKDAAGLSFIPTDGPIYAPEDAGLPADTTVYSADAFIRWGKRFLGVQRSLNHTLRLGSLYDMGDPSTLTPNEIEQIYARYASNLGAHGIEPETAELFLKGPGTTTRIDWGRALSLVLCAGLGLGTAYGVGWFVNSGLAQSFGKANRDVDPETGRYIRCPNCKYDLDGLPTDVCPECGRTNPAQASLRP